MENLEHRTAAWLTDMVFAALFLVPLLALAKAATPLPIPWFAVFIPWLGTFHLLLSWFAGRIIARVFWALARLFS